MPKPNAATITPPTVVTAISALLLFEALAWQASNKDFSVNHQAKWIHGLAITTCMNKNVFVSIAVVDMYAKCGAMKTARKLFNMMQEQHAITWNAMLDRYGTHDLGKEALDHFNEKQKEAVNPKEFMLFLGLLEMR
ncbi:hypothetical protein GYH30_031401 [Glycine max]|nr:hypothetical protein GYH30_031401 [Glycine max]